MHLKLTSIRSFPFVFRWAIIGEEYLPYGKVVMNPYCCTRASSFDQQVVFNVGRGRQALC